MSNLEAVRIFCISWQQELCALITDAVEQGCNLPQIESLPESIRKLCGHTEKIQGYV